MPQLRSGSLNAGCTHSKTAPASKRFQCKWAEVKEELSDLPKAYVKSEVVAGVEPGFPVSPSHALTTRSSFLCVCACIKPLQIIRKAERDRTMCGLGEVERQNVKGIRGS